MVEVSTRADAPSFIFDHLPKTGGTALRAAFEQMLGSTEVSPPVLGRTERWAEKNFSRFRMIIGHFHFPVPFVGRSEQRVRVTVLRDPVDRAISEYFFYRNHVEKLPWHKLTVYAKDHDLYGYLKILELERDIAVSNRYAHHFASQLSRGEWRENRLLSLAKEAIAGYELVGIQEQLPDFLDLFCGLYRLPVIPEIPRANVTSGRLALGELDANTRDKLVRLNRVDLELYAFASSRFQERKRIIFRRFGKRQSDDGGEPSLRAIAPERNTKEQNGPPASCDNKVVEICDAQAWGEFSGKKKCWSGEMLTIAVTMLSHEDILDLMVTIQIVDDVGEVVFGTDTQALGTSRTVVQGERFDVHFVVKADIRHGRYFVTIGLHTGQMRADRCFDWRERAVFFDVVDGPQGPQVGYCKLEARASWNQAADQDGCRKISVS